MNTSIAMALTPSEVRERIKGEHSHLRRKLVELQQRARDAALDVARLPDLQMHLRDLLVEFARHLDTEDTILMPTVAEVPGRGAILASEMRAEHLEQRRLLRTLFVRAERVDCHRTLPLEVDAFVLRLLHDMRDEERTLLTDELLRDDIVAIDQFLG